MNVQQRRPMDEDMDRPMPVPVAEAQVAPTVPAEAPVTPASGYATDDWRSHMLNTPASEPAPVPARGTVYGARPSDADSSVSA
jgi:hypothetical protein